MFSTPSKQAGRAVQSLFETTIVEAIELRHQLHQKPELGFAEHDTAAKIRAQLDALGISWRACAHTGTVAQLAPQAGGPHIALRADIDALPIHETSGVPWTSQHEGKMHACGHDGHTATLLATARLLKAREDELPGPVTLIFQPAEEGGHGARHMIEDGALEGIDVIYGWHNWPAIPEGQAVCPDGTVMCANAAFTIHVHGKGGHASQPELCDDPVLAGAAIVTNLQHIVSRRIAPQTPGVVSVTRFVADSGPTIIPGQAQLGGSIRARNTAEREFIQQEIERIAEHSASTFGCSVHVEHHPRYDATINHAEPAAAMRAALAAELGASWQANVAIPIMASEDFSYYLKACPGAFALVGAGGDAALPCHNAGYDFNDRLIPQVVRLYCRLAGVPLPGA